MGKTLKCDRCGEAYAWDTKDGKTVILKVTIKNKEQSNE